MLTFNKRAAIVIVSALGASSLGMLAGSALSDTTASAAGLGCCAATPVTAQGPSGVTSPGSGTPVLSNVNPAGAPNSGATDSSSGTASTPGSTGTAGTPGTTTTGNPGTTTTPVGTGTLPTGTNPGGSLINTNVPVNASGTAATAPSGSGQGSLINTNAPINAGGPSDGSTSGTLINTNAPVAANSAG